MTFPKDFRSPGEFSHPGHAVGQTALTPGAALSRTHAATSSPPSESFRAAGTVVRMAAAPPVRCLLPSATPAAIFAAALPSILHAPISAPDAAARPRLSSPPLFPCSPCSPAPILPRLSATPTLLSALFSHSRCSFTASVALPFRSCPVAFPLLSPIAGLRASTRHLICTLTHDNHGIAYPPRYK